jgi:hypothetical protein
MVEEILGLLREQERRALSAPPATMRLPANTEVLKALFTDKIYDSYHQFLMTNLMTNISGKLPPPPSATDEEKPSGDAAVAGD